MDFTSFEHVRPLKIAENKFLQVLLTEFDLTPTEDGAELCVRFSDRAPTIWHDGGKREVQHQIRDFEPKSVDYQRQLDEVLLGGRKTPLRFRDPDFPFRYVSGGSLPILRIGGQEYYSLFYRECFPVGWNIANGGSDSRYELLNPIVAVERELREELIIFHPDGHELYVFDAEGGQPLSRPEYAAAKKLWQERAADLHLPAFDQLKEVLIPLKWLDGPDRLYAQMQCADGSTQEGAVEDCFLNINALDFGIEIDRIAKISLDKDARLADGEIGRGQLVNSIVGLFEVHKTNEAVRQGQREFIPDRAFYDSLPVEGGAVVGIAHESFVPRMVRVFDWDRSEWDKCRHKFDLCPVTSRIIQRCSSLWRQEEERPKGSHEYDVFISFAYEPEDIRLAEALYNRISRTGRRVFFSPLLDRADWGEAIDEALESANCLVVVGTKPSHLKRRFVQYEYRAFHLLMLSSLNPVKPQLISLISGFKPEELPLPLRLYQAIDYDPQNPEKAFSQVMTYVGESR